MSPTTMTKSISLSPPSDPERSPVPQPTLSQVPQALLNQLASQLGASVPQLGKLRIDPSAAPLFHAVLHYLSFSPVPHGHPNVPLFVKHCSADNDEEDFDGSSDDGSSSDDSDASDSDEDPETVLSPDFELDTSVVDFVWPPPPHLTAKSLLKLRSSNKDSLLSELFSKSAYANGTHNSAAADASTTYHLLYYSVGEYKTERYDNNHKCHKEMLLVSEHGTKPLVALAAEILEWYHELNKESNLNSRFPLYRYRIESNCSSWSREGLKRSRPSDSVILAGSQMETILADVESFVRSSTREWYLRHGLPYRRAYLFYGPPGTGKTSTVRVIASKFGLSCCFLSMANKKFSNQTLCDALASIPREALLVLEDVDALFNKDRSGKSNSELTFSGMLNALDGIVSVEGVITVMTTNHIERLEKALVRGGRVDRRFRFDLPDDAQLGKLFLSFYPDAAEELCAEFVRKVRARREGKEASGVSSLQQLFVEMRERSEVECVAGVDEFFETYFPVDDDDGDVGEADGEVDGSETEENGEKEDDGSERAESEDDCVGCAQ